jgi:hypothetical protein
MLLSSIRRSPFPHSRRVPGRAARRLASVRPSLVTVAVALGIGYLTWTHPLAPSIPRITVVSRGNRGAGRGFLVGESRVLQAADARYLAARTPAAASNDRDRNTPFYTPPSVDGGSMGSTLLRAT